MTALALRALLTYLLHSTLLLGLAAIVRLALRERSLPLQEAVLRAALVGAFVTSGLQLSLELRPLGGAFSLPAAAASIQRADAAATLESREAAAGPGVPVPQASTAAALAASPGETVPRSAARPATGAPAPAPGAAGSARGAAEWANRRLLAAAFVAGWAVLSVLALLRLAVAARRLRRLLRDRVPVLDAHLAPQAERLAIALGLREVRLSTAPHLGVPLATGVLRPEVCLPPRAVAELGPDEQVALCAHELAHVARRDPAWILLARLAEAAAPLQPLNGWARRRLQELSECLSDDLAVAASARPVGLARSLVDVASWTLAPSPVLPAAAVGALGARSRLGLRVERLMNPLRSLERPRRSLLPLASVAVLATAFLTPVVSATVPAPQREKTKAAPQAATAPQADAEPQAEAKPAPRAEPAPRPGTAAPQANAAPRADRRARTEAERAELERRIEALSHEIDARARVNERQMKELEQEMQALAERVQPNEAELERLGKEMEAAAEELAAAAVEGSLAGTGAHEGEARDRARDGAGRAEAARRMAELGEKMRAQVGALDAEQLRLLSEKSRQMAELVRPSQQQLAELGRLSAELARAAVPDMRELNRQTREAMQEARRAMREAAQAMRRAHREAGRDTGRSEETDKQRE